MKKLVLACPFCLDRQNQITMVKENSVGMKIKCGNGHEWEFDIIQKSDHVLVTSEYDATLEEINKRTRSHLDNGKPRETRFNQSIYSK